MDGKSKRNIQKIVVVVILVLLGVTGLVSSLRAVGGDLESYKRIRKDFDEGRYTYTVPGVISLSSVDRPITFDGFVYVTGDPPKLIVFPRWRSEGASIVATGWSADALVVGSEVDARIPHAITGASESPAIRVPPTAIEKIRVVRDLGQGWYVFERRAK